MGSVDFTLEEVRVRYPASFTATFTDADDAAWAIGTATKIMHVDQRSDVSGLTRERIADPAVRTRVRGRGRGKLGLTKGTLKLSYFLGSGGGTGENAILTHLSKVYGGLASPSAVSATLDSSGVHTGTRLYSAGIGAKIVPGQAVLCGTRGDTKGNGEVIPIAAEATDYIDLERATKGTMSDGNVIYLSYTIYPDEDATVSGIEFLLIGKDAASPSLYNCIGCQASSVEFSNLGFQDGELPIVTIEYHVADFRREPIASTRAMDHTNAPHGPDPALDKGLGGFFIHDADTTTRGYLLGGNFSVSPNLSYVPITAAGPPDAAINGIAGYRMVPGAAEWGFDAYADEGSPRTTVDYDTEFADDAHQIQALMQFGHVGDKIVAFDFQNAYLDQQPMPIELNGGLADMVRGHCEEGATTTDILAADHRIHFFHAS